MIGIILDVLVIVIFTFAKYKHISPLSLGLHNKINQAVFSDEAANGYDVVAYFTEQKPVQGDKNFSYKWNDATWYFASQEHLDLFKSIPEKYAPQFGGYCSFAVNTGFTAKTDPNAWSIIDDKLYFFNDQSFKDKWMTNPTENLAKDIKNWR
jgi:YHS domain-containing protein